MSDFVFPFQWRELPRAVEWLNEQKVNGPAVTLDDFLAWWGQGVIELCYFWGDMGLVVPDRGDFMSFVDGYLYAECTDHSDIPKMMIKPYGTDSDYQPVKLPHGTPDGPYELAYDLTANGLVIPHAEMLKVWRLFNPLPDEVDESRAAVSKPESQKSINYLARQLKALICIHYGADVADNLKMFLDDPASQISTDFAEKRLKAPGAKALQKHLDNVDVETLDDAK